MGIPLVAGRDFTRGDDARAAGVVVINEAVARRVWPGQDPIGRRLRVNDRERTVIGVARNATYYELGEEPKTQVYLATLQGSGNAATFVVHTTGGPMAMANAVKAEIRALDPNLAFSGTFSMAEALDGEIGKYRVSATLVSLFGLLALGLASVGLYGVLSYLVVQSTREFGIRVALGATPSRVAGGVLAGGLKLAGWGIGIGIVGAFAGVRFVTSLLYGITARDPVTFLVVPLFLVAVASLACIVPARRATWVDPMVALKSE